MNSRYKKIIPLIILLFAIVGGFLFVPNLHKVYAEEDSTAVELLKQISGYNTVTWAFNSLESCSFDLTSPRTWMVCPLIGILQFESILLSSTGVIFAWAVDVGNFKKILTDNSAIYETWTVVRDFLNIAFILVLLFSAFSTIFQVDKYNYKKILFTLVIMALLVNFSYPITRVIIDFSNSLMYTLLQEFVDPSDPGKILVSITDNSSLAKILAPDPEKATVASLLASIVFVFILIVTFFMMGILFVIRVIALAILVIFSPIAFVGPIVPGLSKYSNEWWNNLFSQAFFGPIMVFMIYIAVKFMETTVTGDNSQVFDDLAKGHSDDYSDLISSMSKFVIPIVVLWMGMGMAKKMGAAGAEAVTKKAQGFAKWAGKNVGGAVPAAKWLSKKSGVTDGIKARYDKFKKSGFLGTDKIEERVAKIAEIGGKNKAGKWLGGDENATKKLKEKRNREDINKEADKTEYEVMDMQALHKEINALKTKIATGKFNRGDVIKLAGMQKHARGRGSEYEKFMENELKTGKGAVPYAVPDSSGYSEATHMNVLKKRPPEGSSATKIAEWQAELDEQKERKKMYDEWKKNEKEYYQEKRAEELNKDRRETKAAFDKV